MWDSQNITQSPSLLILVLGLLPVLLPACLSGRKFLKSEFNKFQTILFIWIITSLLLTCIPFNLQRRFLTAIYIPVVINAVVYIAGLKKNIRVKNLIFFGLLFLSLISNAIILMMQLNAAENKDPRLYLKLSEANAMLWLEKNSSSEEVVLAPESIGLFIPGWTGQRVVYGHPFESVNGALQQKNISDFYSGKINAQNLRDYLNKNQVFYIWFEKEDSHLWLENLKELFTQVYERDGIILYKVE
ncbi:MAG: hypothetical protein LWX83_19005 [Anaerolineae bacterium]|nr:hypothetical protein [Anaerolineae bacterium]